VICGTRSWVKRRNPKCDAKSLEIEMNREWDGEACVVNVSNQTPCNWGVTIRSVVAYWTYETGEKSDQALPNAYLHCNQSTSLISKTDCVKKTVVIAAVEIQGEEDIKFMEQAYTAPPNQCSVRANFVVKPKSHVARDDLGKHVGRIHELEMSAF
jgi:hypothetical protein